jgi:hypothetical protein
MGKQARAARPMDGVEINTALKVLVLLHNKISQRQPRQSFNKKEKKTRKAQALKP